MAQGWTPVAEPIAAPAGWSPVAEPNFKQTDTSPNELDPNSLGTFASHVWTQINPIAAVKTLGEAIMHPVNATKAIGAAQGAVFDKAKASYAKGDYLTAARHFVDYLIPLVGPSIDKSSDLFQAGHWAAGGGDAIGLALQLFAPKAIASARMQTGPLLKNPNPAEAAAVKFGQDRGIPVDAGTASGNQAVQAVQSVADRSLGGSLVATKATQTAADAFKRVGGDLANDARGASVTPEQAGQGIRDALASKLQAHTDLADASYEKLRQLEEAPQNRMEIAGPKAAVDQIAPPVRAQLRRIVHEMDASGYTAGKLVSDNPGVDSTTHYSRGSGGAAVYDDITANLGGSSRPTRDSIQGDLEAYLGGGKETANVRAALAVAKARALARPGERSAISTPELPANALQMPTRLEASRVTGQEIGLPVDTSAAKQALKPLYDQMMRQMPVTQQQANPGLKAIQNILEGPDLASLSQVDRDLSAIKAIARQQGGLAKFAAGKLDTAVQEAAARGGPEVMRALHTGRQATIGKVGTQDLIEALPGGKLEEPLAVFNRATAPKDAGIELLRNVSQHTPQVLPQIARAKLEGLLQESPRQQLNIWSDLGSETKRLLFPQKGQAQALDHYFLLQKRMADVPNPSGTAYVRAMGETMGAAAVPALWPYVIAEQVGFAGLSKLLHSPAGVRALTRGMSLSLQKAAPAAGVAAAAELVKAAQDAGLRLTLPATAQAPATAGSAKQ